MGAQFSQIYPPKPAFTESTLPDLKGKVFIVTGASAGVGKELARLLYSRNGTVYVAARSAEKAHAAIQWMQESHPDSQGAVHFLKLDLNDLENIKPSVEEFLKSEKRLDVLFNNAGVMVPPSGSTTKQGFELQLGTNCVAPFLFTKLLTPLLMQTAKTSPAGSVRVIWVSSSAAHMMAPKGGLNVQGLDKMGEKAKWEGYAVSKAGNVLHAIEMGRRYKEEGIVSVSLNPGNLKSDLQRHVDFITGLILPLFLYPSVNGAYTELYAGLAPEAANVKPGEWVIPFGRVGALRKDYCDEQGIAKAQEFWEWSEKQVERYL